MDQLLKGLRGKELYAKAIEKANHADDYICIAYSVIENLDDKAWGKCLWQRKGFVRSSTFRWSLEEALATLEEARKPDNILKKYE